MADEDFQNKLIQCVEDIYGCIFMKNNMVHKRRERENCIYRYTNSFKKGEEKHVLSCSVCMRGSVPHGQVKLRSWFAKGNDIPRRDKTSHVVHTTISWSKKRSGHNPALL